MPSAISRLPDEPIVLVLIDFPLEQHMESAASIVTGLVNLVKQSGTDFYILVDLTDQNPGLSDILLAIDLLSPPNNFLLQWPVSVVLVGTHPVLRLTIKRFRQQLGVDLQQYPSMDVALASVRAQIASQK